MHPFRFGVVLESVTDGTGLVETVRRAEELGFSTALIRDHLLSEPFGPQLGPLTALAFAAAHTTTIRLGSLVFDNDFRHPAVLAKEIATLDRLSGGRVELGMGAGWLHDEYRQSGIAFDDPGKRIARLEEAVAILKGLLSGCSVTVSGAHYQIDGLTAFPTPAQTPRPPLLLGGGARRMLSLAGREADIVSVLTTSVASGSLEDSLTERSPERLAEKIGWIRAAAGERFPDIELSLFPDLIVAEDRLDAARQFAAARGWSAAAETVLAMPAVLIGSVPEIAETLRQRRETFGVSYVVVGDADLDAAAPFVAMLSET